MIDLGRLRQLEKSATPGPWLSGIAGSDNIVVYDGCDITGVCRTGEHNREFIATLRNAAPDFFALIDHLTRRAEEAEKLVEGYKIYAASMEPWKIWAVDELTKRGYEWKPIGA